MPSLTAASFLLSLLLASPFMYFLVAGARTFNAPEVADSGAAWGSTAFISGSIVIFWNGLHEGIPLLNGVACGQVPSAVCEQGPYRYLRHPFYLSYTLAFVAMDLALPRVISTVVLGGNMALFLYMALDDERVLAKSPLAEAFADYRKRVGMF